MTTKAAVLKVTTVETVAVPTVQLARFIAALIRDTGNGPYTDDGWGLHDIGDVTVTYNAEVEGED